MFGKPAKFRLLMWQCPEAISEQRWRLSPPEILATTIMEFHHQYLRKLHDTRYPMHVFGRRNQPHMLRNSFAVYLCRWRRVDPENGRPRQGCIVPSPGTIIRAKRPSAKASTACDTKGQTSSRGAVVMVLPSICDNPSKHGEDSAGKQGIHVEGLQGSLLRFEWHLIPHHLG